MIDPQILILSLKPWVVDTYHVIILGNHNIAGFYHSAILNTHDVKGGEDLWKLATRTYTSFTNAKRNNKHFSDMADLNFLMCQAIDNPGLTPSASLRTSLLSVFEDSMIDHSKELQQVIGLEDFIGCGSTHGVGPSLALFDTIRDGELDCACVYPSPLHSREQMQEFVHEMKRVLLDGSIGWGIVLYCKGCNSESPEKYV